MRSYSGRHTTVLASAFAAALAFGVTTPARACEQIRQFPRAQFELHAYSQLDPPQPPAFHHPLEVSLPDPIGRRVTGAHGVAWYRLQVERSDHPEPCGLLLSRADANAVVYLNGEWLGQGGRFGAHPAVTWNRPLYFTFSSTRLNRTSNAIDIGLLTHGGVFHLLGDVALGPHRLLQARYERANLMRVDLGEASTLFSIGIAVLFAAFGLALRDMNHGLLALAAAFHAINSLNLHVRNIPVDYWLFSIGTNLAIDYMACCLAVLLLRLVEFQKRRIEQAIGFVSVAVALIAAVASGPTFERWLLPIHLFVAACGFVVVGILFKRRDRLPPLERLIYLVTATGTWSIAARDLSLQVGRQMGSRAEELTHWFPLIGPIWLFGFGAALLARFLRLSRRVERANHALQLEIHEKRVELEKSFEKMRAFEHEALLTGERERLMREMHDGMGGHLVSALAMIQRQAAPATIAGALRDALDDMRLVLNSLQPSATDIPMLLASLRARLEPRLQSQALRFQWNVRDLPALQLGPDQVLHVLRIVQESITNVLKHARASQITVATGTTRESELAYAFIEIADDGCGIDGGTREGLGLANMQTRAQALGASLRVASGPEGTSIRLLLPTT